MRYRWHQYYRDYCNTAFTRWQKQHPGSFLSERRQLKSALRWMRTKGTSAAHFHFLRQRHVQPEYPSADYCPVQFSEKPLGDCQGRGLWRCYVELGYEVCPNAKCPYCGGLAYLGLEESLSDLELFQGLRWGDRRGMILRCYDPICREVQEYMRTPASLKRRLLEEGVRIQFPKKKLSEAVSPQERMVIMMEAVLKGEAKALEAQSKAV
jgi:hypothetical protein